MTTTLVAVIGPYPVEYGTQGRTTHDDIRNMVSNTPGADLVIIPDLVGGEPDMGWGLPRMRNLAVQYGMDYYRVLIVENDVRVWEDTLLSLLTHDAPVVVPKFSFVSYPPLNGKCYGPPINGQYPLHPITWAPHSIVLLRTRDVVNVPVMFAANAEGTDYKRWAKYGLPAVMALDTPVDILRVPRGYAEAVKDQRLPDNYE